MVQSVLNLQRELKAEQPMSDSAVAALKLEGVRVSAVLATAVQMYEQGR